MAKSKSGSKSTKSQEARERLKALLSPALQDAAAITEEMGLSDATAYSPLAEEIWNAGSELLNSHSNKPQAYATLMAWALVLDHEHNTASRACLQLDDDLPEEAQPSAKEQFYARHLAALSGDLGLCKRVLSRLLREALTEDRVRSWAELFSDSLLIGTEASMRKNNHFLDFFEGFVRWAERYGSPEQMIRTYKLYGKQGSKEVLFDEIIRHIPPETKSRLQESIDDKITHDAVMRAFERFTYSRLVPKRSSDTGEVAAPVNGAEFEHIEGPLYTTNTDTEILVRRMWGFALEWRILEKHGGSIRRSPDLSGARHSLSVEETEWLRELRERK